MASGFFALLDDISLLMDDVASMSKIATKKTAGILGDDLAVNAEKSSGFLSSRELPVLWKISKGSFINKLIILPIAFLLSAFFPSVIKLILILGGIYLAYEGVEKIYEWIFHRGAAHSPLLDESITEEELSDMEDGKVKSAIFVDFILSVEIVIIALSTVLEKELAVQIMVVSVVAIFATVGVYGIVAFIVRMDDIGFKLTKKYKTGILNILGVGMISALPYIIRSLSVIGTIALILVSGGIFVHQIAFIHHLVEPLNSMLGEFLAGLAVGIIALIFVQAFLMAKKVIMPTKKKGLP